jgi:excisionase family DNA binding protein
MAHTRINPRLAKLHRSYTVEEVARLFAVHRNTVRAWIRRGLPTIDGRRPILIQGTALRTFLEIRRASAKRPCPTGTLSCLKSRAPRQPALGMADYSLREQGAGTLRARCAVCATTMYRRTRSADIGGILPGIDVLIVQALPRIAECAGPSLKCA